MQPEMQIVSRDKTLMKQAHRTMSDPHRCPFEKVYWLRAHKTQLRAAIKRANEGGDRDV